MNKIMPYVAGVFFALFGFGVIALLFSYTFSALAYVFPDNLFAQLMGMVLFDIAAIAWLLALIYLCKSVMQYAFSFIGFVFGLAGSLAMVAMEVMLGGQELMEAPAWVNEALIYGFIGAAVVHVVLYYAFKLSAPEISADISLGFETAQITDEAMKQAEAQLLQQRGALGGVIAPRLITNVKRNLGLPVSGDVIDAPSWVNIPDEAPIPVQFPQRTPTATTSPRQKAPGFFDRLRAAGQILIDPSTLHHGPRTYNANIQASNIPTPRTEPTAPHTSATDKASHEPTAQQESALNNSAVEIEPQYHPAGMTPIEEPTQAQVSQESEAANGQAVPLVGFSGNGNGNHPSA